LKISIKQNLYKVFFLFEIFYLIVFLNQYFKINMRAKSLLVVLFNLFGMYVFFPLEGVVDPLEIISNPEYHSLQKEMIQKYSDPKLVQLPLIQGRQCLIKNGDSSTTIEYKDNPFDCLVKKDCISCFTQIERCASITPRTKQYGDCYYTYTEAPYKCCYVGNGKTNRCIPIDPSDTKVFKETIFHMRAYDGDFQGNYEIECSAKITKYSLILSFLYLSLIFF
jgi:hypothetical protein